MLRQILAGGLAQGFGAGGLVQHVVLDLEGQADVAAVGFQGLFRFRHGVRGGGGHLQRGQDQRAGLARVQRLQLRQRDPPAFRVDVHRLTADHAERARGPRQDRHHAQALRGAEGSFVGQHGEGQGLQAVADQDAGGFVVGLVHGGAATAQVVVVHRRQVVMHQRIGVDQLHRAGRRVEFFDRHAKRLAGGVNQQGAQALAAVAGIAHRFMQAAGVGRGGR